MYYCASKDNISEIIQNSERYKLIESSITNLSLVKSILKNNSINIVVHFAAQSHVDNSFNNSLQYTEDNVKGTHTILEAIRQINKDILMIHFSTDEVYGESKLNEDAKSEESILCPTNPYAASKAAAEMYVKSYIHSYNLNCIITRCNNVYGPNQYPEKLIPKFINLLKDNKLLTIHGDGSSLRTFIHVNDVSIAVETIIKKGEIGEIYNIGSDIDHERSVLDVSKLLIKIINKDDGYKKYLKFVEDRPFNDRRYFITNNKLKDLGWIQKIGFSDGIKTLV
jgi:dTDP-glucose 4,6-dehydratase/UDP-glucose 4,6-dehydratase